MFPVFTTDVPPQETTLHIEKHAIHNVVCTDLPPIKKKPQVYIISSSQTLLYCQHPGELTPVEALKFQMSQKDKIQIWELKETKVIG